jgi:homoserine O-acetyltransferase
MGAQSGILPRKLWATEGFASREDYLLRAWDWNFLRRDPMDLLSMIQTWTDSDISDNDVFHGDLNAALCAIKTPSIIMPSTTDLYFKHHDSEIETAMMPNAELRPIRSNWGHRAGNPQQSREDTTAIQQALKTLLTQ